jgi:hypothetical protein
MAGRLKYRRTRYPVRQVIGASAVILLACAPLIATQAPAASSGQTAADTLTTFSLKAFALAGWVALPLAIVFALCVLASQRRDVALRILNQNGRNQRNFLETARMVATIGGCASIIVGAISALYARVLAIRPDLIPAPHLPLTLPLAFACLVGGGLIYALGRIGQTY